VSVCLCGLSLCVVQSRYDNDVDDDDDDDDDVDGYDIDMMKQSLHYNNTSISRDVSRRVWITETQLRF